MQYTLDKKHQRGCCHPSASDSTFMHLYYKKCASSSKLTVLSKVPQFTAGDLSFRAGSIYWLFFTGLFLPGGPQWGCFLWGGGLKEGVFVSSILDFGE